MMARSHVLVSRVLGALAVLLPLGACSTGSERQTPDQATLQACRARAEQIYVMQNRSTLYQPDTSGAPYAASGVAGITNAGLSARYGYDQTVDDCIRGSEANTEGPGGPAQSSTGGIATPAAAQTLPQEPPTPPGLPVAGPAPGQKLTEPPAN